MRTVDLTPTFTQATQMCLMIIEQSDNPSAIQEAKDELLRYAGELDRLAEQAGSSFDAADTPVEE